MAADTIGQKVVGIFNGLSIDGAIDDAFNNAAPPNQADGRTLIVDSIRVFRGGIAASDQTIVTATVMNGDIRPVDEVSA